MAAEGGSQGSGGELLSLAREIRALVGEQHAKAQAGDYAGVVALGENLLRLFRRWEEVAARAGQGETGYHMYGQAAEVNTVPDQAAALLAEALDLNREAVALLEAGLDDLRGEQKDLADSRRAQQAYAAALPPLPPVINTRR